MKPSNTARTYLIYITITVLIVWSVASMQFIFVYKEFMPKFLIVPTILGLILGVILSRQAILKNQNARHQKQFASVLEMADEIATLQKMNGEFEFVSTGVVQTLGYLPEYFYQSKDHFFECMLPEDRQICEAYYESILSQGKGTHLNVEDEQGIVIRFKHKNGAIVWVRHRAKLIFDEDGVTHISGMCVNFSQQIEHENELKNLVNTDQLTSLPNRRALKSVVQKLILSNQPFSLIMMDLDRFKSVNDSLGHSVGDALLKAVSKRFLSSLDSNITVVRFGGDEFVFVVPASYSLDQIMASIKTLVSTPFKIKHLEISVDGSLGFVNYPEDAKDFETLLRFADAAMYQAKQGDVKTVRYAGESAKSHQRAMYIERHIDKAIKEKQIFPYFQPIYAAGGTRLAGVECLARWYTPEYGWISPEEFVSIAESSGSIVDLGQSILEQALDVYREVNQQRDFLLTFSINVSVMQLLDDRFVKNVLNEVSEREIVPETIKLEVTETIFLGQKEVAVKSLNKLRENGIRISLDDFGTGYSALSVLKDSDMDQLKLDRSFMVGVEQSKKAQSLIQHTINMAHDMGLEVVAEGVEEKHHMDFLIEANCNLFQGYYLSRPLNKIDFAALAKLNLG